MGKLKAYLFEHRIFGAGGSRFELYVPDVGIIWLGLGKIINCSEEMKKMQKRVDEIYEWKKEGLTSWRESAFNYKLIGEKDVPKSRVDDYVGWIESERISQEGVDESGNRLAKLF